MDTSMREQMRERMRTGRGFVAALDQSGGSTPKALRLYGIDETAYADEAAMFDRIHEMRTRIIMSPAFAADRIIGAILFEQTLDRLIGGMPTAEYLWRHKGIVPFVKVDTGLEPESEGVRLMKPMPALDALLARAEGHGVFGTKMRSVIALADPGGIDAVVRQQFDIASRILAAGFVPIIEPEVDIRSREKAEAEALLVPELIAALDAVPHGTQVMLKLTLPSDPRAYDPLIAHRAVLRVVALSGGYSRDEAVALLARTPGVVASFSRALTEGLTAQLDDAAFHQALGASIQAIFDASVSKEMAVSRSR